MTIKQIKTQIFPKLFNMLFFMTLFMALGKLIPEIYYNYFDNTVYYSIENPVPINKEVYSRGEDVILEFNRISLVNVAATSYLELVLIIDDKAYELDSLTRQLVLDSDPQEQIIYAAFPLKEDLPCGTAKIRGTVYFRLNNVDKYVKFYTKEFEIVE